MRALILSALLLPAALGGCVERRIEITSEPSGALVYLNDQEIGRTPTEATFLFHGVYDVRLELEGYEPLRTTGDAEPPFYEHAPLDLVAEVIPARFENVQRWHYVLQPALETTLEPAEMEAELLARAGAMREQLAAIPRDEETEAETPAAEPGGAPGAELTIEPAASEDADPSGLEPPADSDPG